MKAVAYSIKSCEKEPLIRANNKKHDITLISNRLTKDTVSYAGGKEAVLVSSSDDLSARVLHNLKDFGVKFICTRSSGADHIDLAEAKRLGLMVADSISYSRALVAEHTLALLLTLVKNISTLDSQTMMYDARLENPLDNPVSDKTIGIIGFGETGQALTKLLIGFGARVIVHDVLNLAEKAKILGAEQVSLDEILNESDIISFHTPLNKNTHHPVNSETISKMKKGVILINVNRGAIFNLRDVYNSLRNGSISKIGMNVYESEYNVSVLKSRSLTDNKLFKALIKNSRVLIIPHKSFLTKEAILEISAKTIENLDNWAAIKEIGIQNPLSGETSSRTGFITPSNS